MSDQIKIKASNDAPDVVAVGNFTAEKKDGFYVTDDRRFANSIIAQGYGTEDQSPITVVEKQPPVQPAPKTGAPQTSQSEDPGKNSDSESK